MGDDTFLTQCDATLIVIRTKLLQKGEVCEVENNYSTLSLCIYEFYTVNYIFIVCLYMGER